MSYFAAVLTRSGRGWACVEVDLADCESIADLADVTRDVAGDLRLLVIEQDDEYMAIVRIGGDDDGDDTARAFLSDGHAADAYPLAAMIAEDLEEIGENEHLDEEIIGEALPSHDSSPFGDAEIVDDLGTSAAELLGMCAHEGTLPIDILVAVCEKAGCADAFEGVRA